MSCGVSAGGTRRQGLHDRLAHVLVLDGYAEG
jgi:hypothetical protein